mmetsp:Transcript_13073/g.33217  ORF Transcript_13073/g.33217 Transcript_13073/m.33217 type:complete len:213 (-) Transcript_13073:242-880(-)
MALPADASRPLSATPSPPGARAAAAVRRKSRVGSTSCGLNLSQPPKSAIKCANACKSRQSTTEATFPSPPRSLARGGSESARPRDWASKESIEILSRANASASLGPFAPLGESCVGVVGGAEGGALVRSLVLNSTCTEASANATTSTRRHAPAHACAQVGSSAGRSDASADEKAAPPSAPRQHVISSLPDCTRHFSKSRASTSSPSAGHMQR